MADQLASDQAVIAAADARVEELRHQRADFPGESPFDPSNLVGKVKVFTLNRDHKDNDGRADWFEQALGFNQSNWQDLAGQICCDEWIARKMDLDEDGQCYQQNISMWGANGNVADVRVGLIKNPDGIVRVTTIMPGRR